MSGGTRVEYRAPSPEVLEHFVRDFYREYSDVRPDREDVLAFTGFLKAVSQALAKDLTRKANGGFDSGVE
ncbi:MAG: hypothetical protein HRF48_01070 [Chloroflexota bacterium]